MQKVIYMVDTVGLQFKPILCMAGNQKGSHCHAECQFTKCTHGGAAIQAGSVHGRESKG